MSYLNEFHKRIEAKDFMGLLQLWEEYCTCDEVDGIELKKILRLISESEYCDSFGNYSESILPLWKSVAGSEVGDDIFELILDIQNTNSRVLAGLALSFLKDRFGDDPYFNEKIRLVGLRNKSSFRKAVRNFKLLNHIKEGSFVFHKAGWGTGEIISISLIREELCIEFENVLGKKQVSFENAFKTLSPLPSEHFLSLRFGSPDKLEAIAKSDPIGTIRKLLTDLGPKTAAEIKEEMCELVIPKEQWTSWWQLARTKLKKEPTIATPSSLGEPFYIRQQALKPKDRFESSLQAAKSTDDKIIACYNFIRDFSEQLRHSEVMEMLEKTLKELLGSTINQGQRFEILSLCLETNSKQECQKQLTSFVDKLDNPASLLSQISIVALQKKLLIQIHATKVQWPTLFAELLLVVDQSLLRDYLFKELLLGSRKVLDMQLERVLDKPKNHAEFLFWYLQKITQDSTLPYGTREGVWRVVEGYLTALHAVEPSQPSLAKKMASLITSKRYALTRQIMEGGDIDFLQEFLLLASKCQSFSSHDNKIFASLATVVCPELKSYLENDEASIAERVIWTTEKGLAKIRDRVEQLSTVEMLDNAKEIETARAHGDLKENSEYKYALERRSRIQGEIRSLSRQMAHAKVISRHELDTSKVSVGTHVTLKTSEGPTLHYTILGPWDSDTENNIISFQSKLALMLIGKKVGESVNIQGITCEIEKIESAL